MDRIRVALVWHGDRATREDPRLETHRLGPTAAAFREEGLEPEAAVYNDDFADEVYEQLLQVDAVQVWVNPIEQGRSRAKLDQLLRDVAKAGVLVSAHPDAILKMGTKDVLYATRAMDWSADVDLYRTFEEMSQRLSKRLASGETRVIKRHRGHSGNGVWKVTPTPDPSRVLVRHAARGSREEAVGLAEWLESLRPILEEGPMLDQEFQPRIGEGMVRCYVVRDRVEGFGHQAINALVPATDGGDPPEPGQRLYFPADDARFQSLKMRLETVWVSQMLAALGMTLSDLPMLWDADFLLGPKTAAGDDAYRLCEINVSSVAPYPESAMRPLARAFRLALSS